MHRPCTGRCGLWGHLPPPGASWDLKQTSTCSHTQVPDLQITPGLDPFTWQPSESLSCQRLQASAPPAHLSYHSLLPRGQLKGQAGPGFPSDSLDIEEGPSRLSTIPLPSALQTQSSREGWGWVYVQALPLGYPELFSALRPWAWRSAWLCYYVACDLPQGSYPLCTSGPHPLNKRSEALTFSTSCSPCLASPPSTSWLVNSYTFLDSTHVIRSLRRSFPNFHLLTPIPSWIASFHDNNNLIKHLPHVRHCSKHATYIDLFSSCNTTTRWVLLVSLFYREGHWEIEVKRMTQVHLANKW